MTDNLRVESIWEDEVRVKVVIFGTVSVGGEVRPGPDLGQVMAERERGHNLLSAD